jgi:hypothetical protein
MCGRFTLTDPGTTLAAFLDALNRPFIVPFFPVYTPSQILFCKRKPIV